MNGPTRRTAGHLGRTGLPEADYKRALKIVREFLRSEERITNSRFRQLTGLNYDQAIEFFGRAVEAGVLERRGYAAGTHYVEWKGFFK